MNRHCCILRFISRNLPFGVLLLLQQTAYSQTEVRTVALFGEEAPGTATGTTFIRDFQYRLPVINDSGRVAFGGVLTGPGVNDTTKYGIWAESRFMNLHMVVRSGDPTVDFPGTMFTDFVPFPSANPTSYGIPVFTKSGNVMFQAITSNPSVPRGIWIAEQFPFLDPTVKAYVNQPTFISPPWESIGDIAPLLRVNDRNEVVFISDVGLLLSNQASQISAVLLGGQTVNIPELGDGVRFGGADNMIVTESGTVGFTGTFSYGGASNNYAIFTSRGGVLNVPFRSTQTLPGIPTGYTLGTFSIITMNRSEQLAFSSRLALGQGLTNSQGIWVVRGTGVEVVAVTGMPVGGDTSVYFAGFAYGLNETGTLHLTDAGAVVFFATLQGTGITVDNNNGVWQWKNGSLQSVVREGDHVPGQDSGVVFSNLAPNFSYPVVNAAGDILVLGSLKGPGITTSNDQCLFLVTRAGDFHIALREGTMIEVRPGDSRRLALIAYAGIGTRGAVSTGHDGRPMIFNNNGEFACLLGFTSFTYDGYFVVNVNKYLPTRRPVKVMHKDITGTLVPVANKEFETGFFYSGNVEDPYSFLQRRTTDDDGILYLDSTMYREGDEFLLVQRAHRESAVKRGHEAVDDDIYSIWYDNLIPDTLGRYTPDSLVNDPGALTTTILGHPTVRINLVVSIEWPAQAEYVNSLVQSIRHASNYLYDVTNGQACLGKVAIYDNKARWEDADIHIYASNLMTPRTKNTGSRTFEGRIALPPKWYGNPSLGPNGIVVEHPLDPNTSVNYRTLIHELGHYVFGFFDEYIDAAGGAIHPNINFGFMDSQYEDAIDPYTSEMSSNATPQYQSTKQFARRGKSCWQYFRDSYTKQYDGLWVEFVVPQNALRPAGIDYVPGPNDVVTTPDVAIDREMVISSTATGSTAAGHLTLLTAGGDVSGKADVTLWKDSFRSIHLGASNDYGWFRFLGADVGDWAFAEYEKNGKYHSLRWAIPPPLLASPSPQGALSDVVDLLPVAGSVRILSAVEFDPGGDAQFIARSTTGFSTAPVIELLQEGIAPSAYTLSGDSMAYRAAITDSLRSTQQFLFRAPDSLGQQFFVFHHHMLVTTDSLTTEIVGEMENIRFEFDSTAGGITEISVLSSGFPPPDGGIPPGQVRVSPVYALYNYPTTEVLAGRVTITYTVLSSTVGAIIYHWQNGWIPLVTLVDTSRSTASAHIDEQGWYAVFLDSASIIINNIGQQFDELPQEIKLHQNYPNPFNPITTIRYSLPKSSQVRLSIFNVLGQHVAVLVDEMQEAGYKSVEFHASQLTSGVYFYRLQAGTFVETKKLLLMK